MDISELLAQMSTEHASDIFLSHGAPPAIVVAGVPRYLGDKPLTPIDTHEIAYSIMSDRQQKEFEATLEMNLGIAPAGLGRFRVNVYRQRGEVALAIRYVPSEIPSIESLRLPDTLQRLVMLPRGLILVVGATGSGKSTTLASMLDHRNRTRGGHILTIEDPIEFLHAHRKSVVDQREVGIDTLSYAGGVTPGFGAGIDTETAGFPSEPEGERGVYLDLSKGGKNGNDGIAALGGGVDEVQQGAFERIVGTAYSDYIVGSGAGEVIDGGGGADVIHGEGGNDTILGGADGDYLEGGAGADTVDGEAGEDNCVGEAKTSCAGEAAEVRGPRHRQARGGRGANALVARRPGALSRYDRHAAALSHGETSLASTSTREPAESAPIGISSCDLIPNPNASALDCPIQGDSAAVSLQGARRDHVYGVRPARGAPADQRTQVAQKAEPTAAHACRWGKSAGRLPRLRRPMPAPMAPELTSTTCRPDWRMRCSWSVSA